MLPEEAAERAVDAVAKLLDELRHAEVNAHSRAALRMAARSLRNSKTQIIAKAVGLE